MPAELAVKIASVPAHKVVPEAVLEMVVVGKGLTVTSIYLEVPLIPPDAALSVTTAWYLPPATTTIDELVLVVEGVILTF